MKIISFSWTTPALLAGAKTCTRRKWNPRYARQFQKGELVAAFDRSPRYKGKRVATIRLTEVPYLENTSKMPEADFVAEGLAWMEKHDTVIQGFFADEFWDTWKDSGEDVYVVRFELVEVL